MASVLQAQFVLGPRSTADLHLLVQGNVAAPEARVSRQGVPDYRPTQGLARPGKDIWHNNKQKILQQGRMRAMLDRFKYIPISHGQIRLLQIKPDAPDAVLNCDLWTANLADVRGRYEALSYCWGADDPELHVHVRKVIESTPESRPDGSSRQVYEYGEPEKFPVRRNLYNALKHLRNPIKPVQLWVDAICINQKEEEDARAEKDKQLSMMSEIYNSARNVCIWLGDADEMTRDAFNLVRDIMNFRTFDDHIKKTGDEANSTRWGNLVKALKADWFGRRWIIQEVAFARQASVHFGDDVLHWDDLADAISLLNEEADALKRQYNNELLAEIPILSATHLVKAVVNVCRKSQDGDISEKLLDLETLVSTFQQFTAKFPADIIHSVRSLAKDAPHSDEEEDFRTMVEPQQSTRDLFIAFVNRCIKNSETLDIICRHWAPLPTDTAGQGIGLPSWISGLSKRPFTLPGEFTERQNGENFVAMTPSDKRRRYNTSTGYHAFYGRNRARRSSIMALARPHIEISKAPSLHSPHGSIYSPDLLLSPTHIIDSSPAFQQRRRESVAKVAEEGLVTNQHGESETMVNTLTVEAFRQGTRGRSTSSPGVGPSPLRIVTGSLPHGTDRMQFTQSTAAKNVLPSSKKAHPTPGPTSNMSQPQSRTRSNVSYDPQQAERPRAGSNLERRYTQEDNEHGQKFSGILEVHGFILGNIEKHSDVMRNGIVPGDWLQKLGWKREKEDNRVPEIIWRTLVADRTPEGGTPPPWYQRACLHALRDRRVSDSKGNMRSMNAKNISEITCKYLKRVECVVWNRRIMELKSEIGGQDFLIGLAPETAQAGDIVCVLFGCSVPVVLRRLEVGANGDEYFELIGEAYVHGKMDGEAVHNKDMVRRKNRRFLLR